MGMNKRNNYVSHEMKMNFHYIVVSLLRVCFMFTLVIYFLSRNKIRLRLSINCHSFITVFRVSFKNS
jgi:hypothetical protein